MDTPETRLRSLFKGLSWRVVATITTVMIAYFITGDTTMAFEIGGIEVFAKVVFYYLHERAWQIVPRGTIRHLESEVLSKHKNKLSREISPARPGSQK